MTLSEVYFYIIIIIYLFFSFFIISIIEDLKDDKCYKRVLKISFVAGFVGVIMELLNWNFLCNFQCVLLTFSPFIILTLAKLLLTSFRKLFKKEPHQVYNGSLSDGFWVENKGDVKEISYYSFYTVMNALVPFLVLTTLFLLIKENFCY